MRENLNIFKKQSQRYHTTWSQIFIRTIATRLYNINFLRALDFVFVPSDISLSLFPSVICYLQDQRVIAL